jgi:acetylornithine aminotransferase
MFELGLMGFVAGGDPSRIRFLPPPAATQKKHIDAALKIIEAAIA